MKNIFKKFIVTILTLEAKVLLARHKPKIIAITGSVGKTSMKDAIYSILKKHYPTRKSEKSFNSDIGVPLTVLGLPNAWSNPFLWLKNITDGFFIAIFTRHYPTYLVLETGVDRPGDMKKLASWIKPDIVVLTRFPDVPVHVEFFKTPEEVVREKMHLAEALKPSGVVIYNHDDQIILREISQVRQQAIGYSRYLSSQFNASADKIVYKDDVPVGISFTVENINDKAEVRITGAVGEPVVYTATGAIAVAAECGISLTDSVVALKDLLPPPGRLRIISGLKGTVLIDDTYNSSPIAVEQALATLKEIKYAKRKIAVLGDMLELGRFSSREHERVGELVAVTADVLITLGVRARKIAEAALSSGMSEKMIMQYEDVAKAGKELQVFLEPGDVVLVKASQGIRAEKVIEEVMQEPELAPTLLVRQDSGWMKR
ncbi:MAG TPA: UDP-N-acetylmuramoyl-tripeptide--D-alanyl-D-alanine ligase [Candidatus Paceibacterota bacterium]|nr:UDP-N-acetylmuramoyl-tripeptide--D-alanyl-D-alanine ligase [Candidatus Paceibacterota bacterium]HMO83085.1 UDP-N-acetylmuramoyl-tripeptide--D-alanyl-D-alanine ligase [Candidatus Paceibacterota bacterium]